MGKGLCRTAAFGQKQSWPQVSSPCFNRSMRSLGAFLLGFSSLCVSGEELVATVPVTTRDARGQEVKADTTVTVSVQQDRGPDVESALACDRPAYAATFAAAGARGASKSGGNNANPDAIVSGSLMGWGEALENAFDLVVFLYVPVGDTSVEARVNTVTAALQGG